MIHRVSATFLQKLPVHNFKKIYLLLLRFAYFFKRISVFFLQMLDFYNSKIFLTSSFKTIN